MARGLTTVSNIGSDNQSLGVKIEYSKKAAAMFSTKDRNAILKLALDAAATRWIENVLPKRFNTAYMRRAPFNHHIDQLSLKQKIRKAVFQGQRRGRGQRYNFSTLRPLIMSGVMHDRATTGAHAKTTAPKGNVRSVIKIPTGHGLKAKQQELIRIMPKREVETIGNDFVRNVIKLINSAGVVRTKSGRVSKRGGRARRSLSGVRAKNTIRQLANRF